MSAPDLLPSLLYEHRDRLPMFVVYDHPSDHPDHYVARLWVTLPEAAPTNVLLKHPDLDVIRDELERLGLAHLARQAADDPKILETWI
jgi:hypothetical protein